MLLLLNRKAPHLFIWGTSIWLFSFFFFFFFFFFLVTLSGDFKELNDAGDLFIYTYCNVFTVYLSFYAGYFCSEILFSATTRLTWSLNMYSRVYSSNDSNSSESILSISRILEISKVNSVSNAGFWTVEYVDLTRRDSLIISLCMSLFQSWRIHTPL